MARIRQPRPRGRPARTDADSRRASRPPPTSPPDPPPAAGGPSRPAPARTPPTRPAEQQRRHHAQKQRRLPPLAPPTDRPRRPRHHAPTRSPTPPHHSTPTRNKPPQPRHIPPANLNSNGLGRIRFSCSGFSVAMLAMGPACGAGPGPRLLTRSTSPRRSGQSGTHGSARGIENLRRPETLYLVLEQFTGQPSHDSQLATAVVWTRQIGFRPLPKMILSVASAPSRTTQETERLPWSVWLRAATLRGLR